MSKREQAKRGGQHGGSRAGAGRGTAPPTIVLDAGLKTPDPAAFLSALMQNESVDIKLRHDAAKKLVDVEKLKAKVRKGDVKRESAEQAVATGRFAPMQPPKLRLVK